MNPFIRQFGKPSGGLGRLLGKVMAVSNRKMHGAVLSLLTMKSDLNTANAVMMSVGGSLCFAFAYRC